MQHIVEVDGTLIGDGNPLVLVAGPCVIEDFDTTHRVAAVLRDLTRDLGIPFFFKTSYDKANRTSLDSYRGPGLAKGLDILGRVKAALGIRILSDVHRVPEIEPAAQVLDVLQIPAFLCRQTDFLIAAAKSGRPVNVKKGQFLAPWDMKHVIDKMTSTGNDRILLTERGTAFGYHNLVVDFRGLGIMREFGRPVIFDATHSVQLPGAGTGCSGGQREFIPMLAKAAVAAGVDGIFMEVHENPDKALCDGPNSLPLDDVEPLLRQLLAIRRAVSEDGGPGGGEKLR